MVQIIPTLFATTEEDFRYRLNILLSSKLFGNGWVQLDLMDNKFVPNLSVGTDIIEKYSIPFKKEAQLMVVDPVAWLEGLVRIKVDRIIFPIEIKKNINEIITKIKSYNIEAGLSLNPNTDVQTLYPYIDFIDSVLLMSVNPGLEGQKFDDRTYQKIQTIKQKSGRLMVGVDGGISDTNAKDLVSAGANYLAIGSFLFKGDFDQNLEKIING